ncbi:N-isopropylammelide isopropylaminohydrolase [Kutzneria albida DSM 43870]|uniref:N-isopropylammelide isopropylaminohydrolase n=1 Tax=Kutzneria albida DSM 43870 TaxID=1449976 RepID=W5W720_9PSEU|nr:N-isopropylammelide isopropylaminohydrolase [Kutzneria albida DSM 43870]
MVNSELLIRSVRPWPSTADTPPLDVHCRDGEILAMAPNLTCPPGAEQVDGRGGVLLPAFTDAHARLDSVEDLRAAVSAGATLIRWHVPLDRVRAALSARDEVSGLAEVQVVASPVNGVLREEDGLDRLDAALAAGADVVGGVNPAGVDRDPVRHLDIVFGLAEKYQRGVDLVLTDPGELGLFELELVCERTAALGLGGRVAVSRCTALSTVDEVPRGRLLDQLAENEVGVIGVDESLPLRELRQAGVRVGLGGGADLLERAWRLADRVGYTTDNLVEMCVDAASRGGAAVLGERDPGRGLVEGDRADLVVLPSSTVVAAATERPVRTLVVHRGRVVA